MFLLHTTSLFATVILVRVMEWIIQMFYIRIVKLFHVPKKTHQDPLSKRLSADVSIEFHAEVCAMATQRHVTIKEYIIGAVMMRMKLDRAE
jgi:hypothetical protein